MPLKAPEKGDGLAFAHASDNPKAPHYKGLATDPDGVVWSVAIWKRTTRRGQDMLSVRLAPPRDGEVEGRQPAPPPDDDEAPF